MSGELCTGMGWGWGQSDRKLSACSSLITMHNLVVVPLAVCAHVGGPKYFGKFGTAPLRWGVVDPYKHATPHM